MTNRFGPPTAGLTGLFTHMNAGKRGIGARPQVAGRRRRCSGGWPARADIVVENFRPGVLAPCRPRLRQLAADQPRAGHGVGVGLRPARPGGRPRRLRPRAARRVRPARPPGRVRRPPDHRHRHVPRRPGGRAARDDRRARRAAHARPHRHRPAHRPEHARGARRHRRPRQRRHRRHAAGRHPRLRVDGGGGPMLVSVDRRRCGTA